MRGELERAADLVEPEPGEVAFLAQVVDHEPELGRRLRVGLGQRLRRAGLDRGRPRRPGLARARDVQRQRLHGWRRRFLREFFERELVERREGLVGWSVEALAAEHGANRLRRPCLDRLTRG